ncbi:MAG: hypothetical protein EKK45_28210 [Curvibacter sp.]|nr:MAG: hypothetical protein EKK45_28210 [Curvibacter sp.]
MNQVPPRVPPRFVPTLTEVVQVTAPAAPTPAFDALAFEEQLVHRVMQRVDALLEQRVQQAVAHVIEEQTRSLLPRLREELDSVVRGSVSEALAQELASPR